MFVLPVSLTILRFLDGPTPVRTASFVTMPVNHNQCFPSNASCRCRVMPGFSSHTMPPRPAMPAYSCSCLRPVCQSSMHPWWAHFCCCCEAAWATHHQHTPLRSGPWCCQAGAWSIHHQHTPLCTSPSCCCQGLQATSGCTQTVTPRVSRETQTDWHDPDETTDAVQEQQHEIKVVQDLDETTDSGAFSPILFCGSVTNPSSPVLLPQDNGDQPPSPTHTTLSLFCEDLLGSSRSHSQLFSRRHDSSTFCNRASVGLDPPLPVSLSPSIICQDGLDSPLLVSLNPLLAGKRSAPAPQPAHDSQPGTANLLETSPETSSSESPLPAVLTELVYLSLDSPATGSSLATASPQQSSDFVYDLPAMQSTNMMHLVRQNPALLHFWANSMLEGVPKGRRDCLDLAGKLPLCLCALEIGIIILLGFTP